MDPMVPLRPFVSKVPPFTMVLRECPPGAEMPFPRARSAAWLWSLATGWTSTKASNICGVPAKALAALRGAKSACERWFRLQNASNKPENE